jgi:hypothetical protein
MTTRNMELAQMPSTEKMLQQTMEKTNVLGVSQQNDKFYESYFSSIANRPKSALGLVVLAWQTAGNDSFRSTPSVMAEVTGKNFEAVIKAIAPNIAEDAIRIRNQTIKR